MAKIAFDIKYRPQIESGEYEVETRDGFPARIICWDSPIDKDRPIIGIVYDDQIEQYKFDGRYDNYFETSNYDLFIVTPEPELSEFEKGLVKFYRTRGEIQPDKDGVFNRHEVDELLHKAASELLAIARTELVKQGYVIEKKAFHDAVKKVSPEIMKEVSENVDMQIALRTEYEKGREDVLKDLPRWKLFGNGACGGGERPIALVKNPVGYNLTSCLGVGNEKYIMLSDLEKLPGFKEDE